MVVFVYLALISALFYNAVLAYINANVSSVALSHVIAAEFAILALGGGLIAAVVRRDKSLLSEGYFQKVLWWGLFFVLLYMLNAALASAFGGVPSLKPIRDVLIVFVFLALGVACTRIGVNPTKLLALASIAVLAFLLLEMLDTRLYVRLFNIARYYANTRGEGQEVAAGLFKTADSFRGRFTFGFRQAQRLSSLFLEQTTHANFALVLAAFVSAYWRHISKVMRALFCVTIIMIVLGTDSRQAFGVCLFIIGGYWLFPRLGRISLYLYMPLAIAFMWLFFYNPDASLRQQDTFAGRLTYSISRLMSSDVQAWLGLRMAERVFDSGYTYVLYAQSLVGFLAFLVLLPSCLPYRTVEGRRFAHAVMILFTVNLAVSGSTIFSIKTSALLWFLIGLFGAWGVVEGRRQLSPMQVQAKGQIGRGGE